MGERPRSIGIEAERKAQNFIRVLGYVICELNNEEYDIDCLAEFPIHANKYRGLIKPRYSPKGLVALEITTERVRKKKVTKFEEKIIRYNDENLDTQIGGGVILTDEKVSPRMYRYMENKNIYGWGIRRQFLYREKIRTFNSWRELYGTTTEIPINRNVSYLRCFSSFPADVKQLFHFAVFSDDHIHKLSITKVKAIMDRIRRDSLFPLIDRGLLPLSVYFEFHALGGIQDLRKDLLSFIEAWKMEGIKVFISEEPFKDYRAFPVLL